MLVSGFLTATLLGVGKAAAKDESVPIQQSAITPAIDRNYVAEAYAIEFDVSVAEAVRRLDLQVSLDAPMQAIRAVAPSRFAAAWVEHRPEFRGVVLFTGGPEGLDDALA